MDYRIPWSGSCTSLRFLTTMVARQPCFVDGEEHGTTCFSKGHRIGFSLQTRHPRKQAPIPYANVICLETRVRRNHLEGDAARNVSTNSCSSLAALIPNSLFAHLLVVFPTAWVRGSKQATETLLPHIITCTRGFGAAFQHYNASC